MSSQSTAVTSREPELLGQTVVVIGGSAGIGLATARLARAAGAQVVLTGRDPDRLKHAAHESMTGGRPGSSTGATDLSPEPRWLPSWKLRPRRC